MEKLLKEVNLKELDEKELERIQGGKISAAQCAYFWTLCVTGASDLYGCGSTQANCFYYKRYC